MVRHFERGIPVSPETLAYDVIANVGPKGNFLKEPHTVKSCRQAFWRPTINYRDGHETWLANGRLDAAQRARKRWQVLLAEHQDPPLDATTARLLEEYVEREGGRMEQGLRSKEWAV
jgi:trimethylamine--corrinoid protein Co-methyltransferase